MCSAKIELRMIYQTLMLFTVALTKNFKKTAMMVRRCAICTESRQTGSIDLILSVLYVTMYSATLARSGCPVGLRSSIPSKTIWDVEITSI